MNSSQSNFPKILAAVFVLFFIALGIHPVDRTVWIAEVIPVIAIFAGLAATYKHFRFTNLAYALAAFWMFWHTIGGHYTFANVPFGWVTDLLGSERNHFDRIGHFSVGFFAYGAQKDMLADTLGAVVVLVWFWVKPPVRD